jgi:hypothetical protein
VSLQLDDRSKSLVKYLTNQCALFGANRSAAKHICVIKIKLEFVIGNARSSLMRIRSSVLFVGQSIEEFQVHDDKLRHQHAEIFNYCPCSRLVAQKLSKDIDFRLPGQDSRTWSHWSETVVVK